MAKTKMKAARGKAGFATHKEDVSPAQMKKRSEAAMAQMGQPS